MPHHSHGERNVVATLQNEFKLSKQIEQFGPAEWSYLQTSHYLRTGTVHIAGENSTRTMEIENEILDRSFGPPLTRVGSCLRRQSLRVQPWAIYQCPWHPAEP
jgi:hypothetical protein